MQRNQLIAQNQYLNLKNSRKECQKTNQMQYEFVVSQIYNFFLLKKSEEAKNRFWVEKDSLLTTSNNA